MMSTRCSMILLAASLLFIPVPAQAKAERRVLIVTIRDFSKLSRSPWRLATDLPLPSAAADGRLMTVLLRDYYGFRVSPEDVLRDGTATLFRVLTRLDQLARKSEPGDYAVVYISTHGSRMPRGGKCLLLHDFPLTEVALTKRLHSFKKGVHLAVIIDACYAASLSKGVAESLGYGPVKFVPYDDTVALDPNQPRSVFVPEIAEKEASAPEQAKAVTQNQDKESPAYIRLAACGDDGDAWVIRKRGGWVSAFTEALYSALSQSPYPLSYKEAFTPKTDSDGQRTGSSPLVRGLNGYNVQQEPQLAGSYRPDDPVFAPPDRPWKAVGVPVMIPKSGSALLLGGEVWGMDAGELFRLSSVRARPGANAPAVRVKKVALTQADGSVARRLARGRYWGCRMASSVKMPRLQSKLGIVAQRPVGPSLVKTLRQIPGVTIVSSEQAARGQAADVVLELDRQERGLAGRLYAPGQQLSWRFGAANEAELVGALRPLMNLVALRRFFDQLSNPAAEFHLQLWSNRVDNRFVFDEPVQFFVRSDRDAYLHLFSLEPDATVRLLFPNPLHPENRIEAGKQYAVPPEGARRTFQILASPPPGEDLVVAVATRQPLDRAAFDAAVLPAGGGYRGIDPYRSIEFGREFRAAMAKGLRKGLRVVADPDVIPTQGWALECLRIWVSNE